MAIFVFPHLQSGLKSRESARFRPTAVVSAGSFPKPSQVVEDRFQLSDPLMQTPLAPQFWQVASNLSYSHPMNSPFTFGLKTIVPTYLHA